MFDLEKLANVDDQIMWVMKISVVYMTGMFLVFAIILLAVVI